MGSDVKPTNPKDAVGIRKYPGSVIPRNVLGEVGLAFLEGARKYGRHNYRVTGVRASVYFDAVSARHLDAWWEGEDIDPESGVHHITKAIAGLTVLRDSMLRGNWVDDRPPRVAPGWQAELNRKAGEIIDRYPDALPAHCETDAAPPTEPDPFTVPHEVRSAVPFVEPARILAKDLTEQHEGLRFRVVTVDRDTELYLTPQPGFTGVLRLAQDTEGETQFLESPYGAGSTGYCVGPNAVLEFVP